MVAYTYNQLITQRNLLFSFLTLRCELYCQKGIWNHCLSHFTIFFFSK